MTAVQLATELRRLLMLLCSRLRIMTAAGLRNAKYHTVST
jgi:hypothetical protein